MIQPPASAPPSARRCCDVMALLASIPTAVLPLSLTTVNLGSMWLAVQKFESVPSMPLESVQRIFDVCATIALLQLCAMAFKCVSHGASWTLREHSAPATAPAFAAGFMAWLSLAGWLHTIRGASHLAIVVWFLALALLVLNQCVFLRSVFKLLREGSRQIPSLSLLAAFKKDAVPPWFVPLVGVSAATVSGGGLVRFLFEDYSPTLVRICLYFPTALGAFWLILLLLPLWYLSWSKKTLFSKPPSAILMAPPAIVLAGWRGATVDSAAASLDHHESALTHILAVLTLLAALPIVPCVPNYLFGSTFGCSCCRRDSNAGCLSTCFQPYSSQFDPKIATVGFPLEISAIALIQYQQLAKHVSGAASFHYWLFRISAWVLLGTATIGALVILWKFAFAGIRAVWKAVTTGVEEGGAGGAAAAGGGGGTRTVAVDHTSLAPEVL